MAAMPWRVAEAKKSTRELQVKERNGNKSWPALPSVPYLQYSLMGGRTHWKVLKGIQAVKTRRSGYNFIGLMGQNENWFG